MSNIHQLHSQTQSAAKQANDDELRLEQASDWIAKLDRSISTHEKLALRSWLAASPQNIEVLLEVAQIWDKMDELSRLSDLFPSSTTDRSKHKTKWFGAIAASIIFAFTLSTFMVGSKFWPLLGSEQATVIAQQMNYQTGVGESNTIVLPDNSKLVLNTNSFVQIRYTAAARIIDLQRGEIHIDVAHDKTRPLSVLAQGKVIQAVGTAFNVEVRSKLVELIVTEGKVLVAEQTINKNNSTIDVIGKKLPKTSMAIAKGEKINLDLTGTGTEKIVKVNPVDVAASLSWRQGNLIFRGEALSDAMSEISRYTNINFELDDDLQRKNVHVAGMFKTGDVNGLLDVLSRNFNISYQKVGDNKIVLNYAG